MKQQDIFRTYEYFKTEYYQFHHIDKYICDNIYKSLLITSQISAS